MSGSGTTFLASIPALAPAGSPFPPRRSRTAQLRTQLTPAVYVLVDDLPPLCRPAQVIREGGKTLLWVDPSALCVEVAFYTREHLTDRERIALRIAFNHSSLDLHTPPDDTLLEGTVRAARVPESLRLPLPLPTTRSA